MRGGYLASLLLDESERRSEALAKAFSEREAAEAEAAAKAAAAALAAAAAAAATGGLELEPPGGEARAMAEDAEEVPEPPVFERNEQVHAGPATLPGLLPRLATGFGLGIVVGFDLATRTYSVKPLAMYARTQNKLDNVSACIKCGGQVRVGGVTRTKHRTAAPCRSQFRVQKSVAYSPTPRQAATSFVYAPSVINQNGSRWQCHVYPLLFTPKKRDIIFKKRTNLYLIAFTKIVRH